MDLQQPCKHRKKEYCKFSGRLCFGAQRDDETGEYKVDFWTERTCPTYEAPQDEKVLIQKELSQSQPSMEEAEVVIRIFGPMEVKEECGDDCVAETVDMQAEILQGFFNRRYGAKVRVEGIDIASEVVEDYPEVREYIEKGVPLVVMINDKVKFLDAVDLPALKQEIKKLGIQEVSS